MVPVAPARLAHFRMPALAGAKGVCAVAFRPLSVRRGIQEPFDFHPGIPAHIKVQLAEWVQSFLYHRYAGAYESMVNSVITLLQWPITAADPQRRLQAVMERIDRDNDAFLDLLDLLCGAASPDKLQALDLILDTGMSEWRVRFEKPRGLEERLTEEARTAYRAAVSVGDPATEHIAEAWVKAFGRQAEAGAAWHAAVKALECLLQPIVEPKNQRATLGTMVKALRAKPEKWRFAIASADGDLTATPFLGALEIVGYEPGRHGTDPSRATIEQARIVVLQAVAVVEWLRAGALERI